MLIPSLLLSFGTTLAAQQAAAPTDIQTQIQEPERKRKIEAEARKEAEKAREREVSGSEPDVTYEQVMADPDNIDLNFLYARSQVKKGQLRTATATLERILLINPNLPKVRLFYVVVLLRLDNLEEAEKEVEILKKEQMPTTLRSELNEYARVIRKRRSKTHYSFTLGAGLDYDDNRNAAPASGQRLLGDAVVMVDAASTRKSDVAKTMLVGATATRELSYQAGHQLFANANYYRAEQTNVRILNIENYSIQGGFVYRAAFANVTPTLEFDHLKLAETTYLRSRTAKVQFDRQLTQRLDVSAETSYARQSYSKTQIVPTGDDRTGDKIDGGVTLGIVLTPTMKINAGVTHTSQGAVQKFDAFRREAFTVTHSWLLGHGQFLISSLTGNYDRYQQPETSITVLRTRIDDTYRAHATYGLPLGFIGKPFSAFVWTASYDYFQALSNYRNYAYSNSKVSTLLTYQFDL